MSAPSPPWTLEALRLPKSIENDPTGPALHAALRAQTRPLWVGGALLVPSARWNAGVEQALGAAQAGGGLVRGLEQIETTLGRQARGLSLAEERSGTPRGARVSRLLLLSGDGSERFYRNAERLISASGPRLLAIRMDVDSARFAAAVHESSGVVRALLIDHKELVSSVLRALYP
jgi:hypothetical protein